MAHAITNYANLINVGDHASPSPSNGLFARVAKAIADYREYVATFDELNGLTDRELADLGISRLSVRDVARDAVYGR